MRIYQFLSCVLVAGLALTATAQEDKAATQEEAPAKAEAAENQAAEESTSEDDTGSTIEKASYMIGYNMINRLKQQGAVIDFDQMVLGLRAAFDGEESRMSREEQRSVLESYQAMMREKVTADREKEAEKNRLEGEAAFAEFAKQEGAKELEDGVMYMVIKEGDGEIPELPDRVKVNYKGTYVNGEEFDSTAKTGKPMERGVTQLVPGFSKALQNMKVGSTWKVIIRGDKAYGMRPRPPMELNKTLIFEIELLEILEPK